MDPRRSLTDGSLCFGRMAVGGPHCRRLKAAGLRIQTVAKPARMDLKRSTSSE